MPARISACAGAAFGEAAVDQGDDRRAVSLAPFSATARLAPAGVSALCRAAPSAVGDDVLRGQVASAMICLAWVSWSWKRSGRVSVRTFRPRSSSPAPGQVLQHEGAEAADRALLDGDQHLVLARQPQDQLRVQRLGEAGVGDGGREAARGQLVGGLQRLGQPRAERQDGDRRALAHDAALADRQRLAARRHRDAVPSPRG